MSPYSPLAFENYGSDPPAKPVKCIRINMHHPTKFDNDRTCRLKLR